MPNENHDVAPPRERANEGAESLRYMDGGGPRAAPHDLERSRRHGTISKPGPLPYFGPVIERPLRREDVAHRCVECGRRDHAAMDCPNVARLLAALDR